MTSNHTTLVLGLGAAAVPVGARLAPGEIVTSTGFLSTVVSSGPWIALTVTPSVLAGSVRI